MASKYQAKGDQAAHYPMEVASIEIGRCRYIRPPSIQGTRGWIKAIRILTWVPIDNTLARSFSRRLYVNKLAARVDEIYHRIHVHHAVHVVVFPSEHRHTKGTSCLKISALPAAKRASPPTGTRIPECFYVEPSMASLDPWSTSDMT